jgi:hypothetical protein
VSAQGGGPTAFVQNPGTSNEVVVSQQTIPFQHPRLAGSAGLQEVIRQVNLLEENTYQATLASRSLPFAGPCSYLVGYSFTNGQATRLFHRLQTDRVRLWLGHKQVAYGDLKVTDVTAQYVAVVPNATFTADVMFLVIP